MWTLSLPWWEFVLRAFHVPGNRNGQQPRCGAGRRRVAGLVPSPITEAVNGTTQRPAGSLVRA